MKTCFLIQSQNGTQQDSVQAAVTDCVVSGKFDCARVAVAYATVSGARSLLEAFDNCGLQKSQWLLGLDDSVTQPGVIELLRSLHHSTVRIASFEKSGRRFHPKFYAFTRIAKPSAFSAMIGSVNLTANAFHGNGEAAVLLECKSKQDKDAVNSAWDRLWTQGYEPSVADLQAYSEIYKNRRGLHRKLGQIANPNPPPYKTLPVLTSDKAEVDPSVAKICWIECGKVTAMGRELEFKAEQGLFFGLDPGGGEPVVIPFLTSDGSTVTLRMKYQKNHMWRLQMTVSVPEVRDGLRPRGQDGKLGRSPYVAVFERTPGNQAVRIRFLELNSKKFAALRKRTIRSGTLGRTTTREYGWCD